MAADGYLAAVLADGARPFRYRGRVRALLGLPEDRGIPVGFAGALPGARFTYAHTQLTGEFYVPDELLAAPARTFTVEDVVDWTALDAGHAATPAGPGMGRLAERVDQPASGSPRAVSSGGARPGADLVIPGTSTWRSPSESGRSEPARHADAVVGHPPSVAPKEAAAPSPHPGPGSERDNPRDSDPVRGADATTRPPVPGLRCSIIGRRRPAAAGRAG